MPYAVTLAIAQRLRAECLNRSFGAMRFWRFAVMRPNDQIYRLSAIQHQDNRLDLTFMHDSGLGSPGQLQIWSPQHVEISAQGIYLGQLQRVVLDDFEAWAEGDQYHIRTPKGEGSFAISGTPALSLEI